MKTPRNLSHKPKISRPDFSISHLRKASTFSKANLAIFVLIFGAIGAYALFQSSAAGSVIPIPAANVNGITVGPGFVEASAREVVRTSTNKVYIATSDDNPCQLGGSGVIRMWKGTGAQGANANVPTGFAEQDSANHPVSAGTGSCIFSGGVTSVLLSPDIRLDSSNLIHLAYIDGKTGSVYYQTYSTATDTWGARVVIGTGGLTDSGSGWPRGGQVALSLDTNDVPHVAFASSGSSNAIKYVNKVSGSWSSAITVGSGTNVAHPSMVTSLDGSLHLAWLDNSQASHSTIKYSHYSGTWGTVETVTTGDTQVLANGDDDQGPSIATDSQNRPHVLFMDGTVNGSDDYVRMRYRTTGGTWTDNTPPGTAGASNPAGTWFAHTPQNYISSADDEYVFLGHDNNISPGGYQYQTGGIGNNWSAYATIDPRNQTNTTAGAPGLDGSASTRFDPLRPGNTGLIDLLYFDEKDGTAGYDHHATVYYKAIDISSTLPSGPTANLWVDTSGGSCTRQASASTYSDAAACGSLDAANDACQSGDTVIIKGGTYNSGNNITGTNGRTSMCTFKSASGETATFGGCGTATGDDGSTVQGATCIDINASWITLDGGTNKGIKTASFTDGGQAYQGGVDQERGFSHLTLTNLDIGSFNIVDANTVVSNSDIGPTVDPLNSKMLSGADAAIIQNNVFHDSVVVNTGHMECLYLTAGDGYVIRGNTFGPCAVIAIHAKENPDNVPTGYTNNIVENNIFLPGANAPEWTNTVTTCSNFTFRNNIVSDGLADDCSPETVTGNILLFGASGCSSGWSYNVFKSGVSTCGTNAKTGTLAQLFTNFAGNDFHTPAGSPAIDAGNPSSYPTTDIEGTTRFSGTAPDAGAYESSFTGGGGDTTAPTVSMTAPANNATVSGSSVTVSATASDNVAVAGVQFKLDGANLASEDTTSPYSISWDSTQASNGSHTLTATARDAAGNTTTSTAVTVSVSNSTKLGDLNNDNSVNILDLSILLSHYGQAATPSQGDLNSDGTVSITDLSILLSKWGS